ncbi:2-octaprenyl-3-methyl-6-methoxy-1,4-benzoquinol hydroxylase, partial [Pseudomonas aeruginosa]
RLTHDPVRSGVGRRRRRHELVVSTGMEGWARLCQAGRLPRGWRRNAGVRLVDGQREATALFVRQALGLSGDLPSLARV